MKYLGQRDGRHVWLVEEFAAARFWTIEWSHRLPRRTKKAVWKSVEQVRLGRREGRRVFRAFMRGTLGQRFDIAGHPATVEGIYWQSKA